VSSQSFTIVLIIKNEHKKRPAWRISRILELRQSTDNQIRSAVVRTGKGTIVTRPISSLHPLELSYKPTTEEEIPHSDKTHDSVQNYDIAQTPFEDDDDIVEIECEIRSENDDDDIVEIDVEVHSE